MTRAEDLVRVRVAPLLILGAAILLQLLVWRVQNGAGPRPLQGDEPMYQARAAEWARGAPTPPLFLWPPGQEVFLGGLCALFGSGLAPVAVVQGALLLACGLLLRSVLLGIGFPERAALVAMALLLLDPQVASFAQYLWPEILHLFLVLLALWLLFAGSRGMARTLGAGAALGLALVTKSVLGPFVAVIAAVAAMQGSEVAQRGRLSRFASVLLPALLIPSLVAMGNGIRWGVPRVGSSLAFNLWVGLNDPVSRGDYYSVVAGAGSVYLGSGATPAERDRAFYAQVRDKVAREGIGTILAGQVRKQLVHLLDRESFFTDQLPGGRWGPSRRSTPLESSLRVYAHAVWGATLVLSVFGLFLFPWPARWREAALPAGFLAMNAALFLFLHVKTRYRVAFLPALGFFAAAPLAFGAPALAGTRARLAAAAAVSASLLAIAFGVVWPD